MVSLTVALAQIPIATAHLPLLTTSTTLQPIVTSTFELPSTATSLIKFSIDNSHDRTMMHCP